MQIAVEVVLFGKYQVGVPICGDRVESYTYEYMSYTDVKMELKALFIDLFLSEIVLLAG